MRGTRAPNYYANGSAIVTLIVTVRVIPVGVMTIIVGLTLIVIALGIIVVGIPWPYGNDNLSFRLRRNQSEGGNLSIE